MQALIDTFTARLIDRFDGKTIGGAGADYATELGSTGTIHVYIDEWDNVQYPCIRFVPVQELFVGHPFECCEGGVMRLEIDLTVFTETKTQGQRMAWALAEELRQWLCGLNESGALTPDGYSYVPMIEIPTSDVVQDGVSFGIHLRVNIRYLRESKS